MLDNGHTDDITDIVSAPEKKFGINFTKENTKLCLSLTYLKNVKPEKVELKEEVYNLSTNYNAINKS